MHRLHTLPRTLAALLVIGALAAPMAAARPLPPEYRTNHSAPSERVQDLRHLEAGNMHTSSLAGTSETNLDSLGPVYAAPTETKPDTLGPVYWSYDHPAPIPAAQPTTVDDGTPWMTIGISLAVACFLIAAAAAMTARLRTGSERVAT
jgi:hypothetical protein